MQTFNVSKTRKGATFLTDDQSHNLALKLIMACYIHCGFDLYGYIIIFVTCRYLTGHIIIHLADYKNLNAYSRFLHIQLRKPQSC